MLHRELKSLSHYMSSQNTLNIPNLLEQHTDNKKTEHKKAKTTTTSDYFQLEQLRSTQTNSSF